MPGVINAVAINNSNKVYSRSSLSSLSAPIGFMIEIFFIVSL